ncbi:MAG: hypothetical protein JXQ81_12605 [Desulfuromonadales bacterium]|nr:hypothetical protein [Desulfuromonadales bacterium]MBN2793342.1 hypothetical protein [Desulfuromonadales bacterium]
MSLSTVSYRIDRDNLIVDVSEEWDRFAIANGGSCTSHSIIGHSLFDFISGDPTRMFVRVLLDYCRHMRQPVSRPYRCDSPDLKRFMEMKITCLGDDLLLTHRLLRTEPISPPVNFPLGDEVVGQGLNRCSICNRIFTFGHWLDVDLARRRGLVEPSVDRVEYVVCPVCQASQK